LTDSNYTHILAIVDRSGSMRSSVPVMSSALNEFFENQAEVEGKCLVDYVQFGSIYEKTYSDRPVAEAKAEFHIEGMTALLDAIGRGTTELGTKLAALPKVHRPGKVQVVIVTDGHENSSREWTSSAVKELIAEQENKYGWNFVFLGANIDAVAVGATFGLERGQTLTYDIGSADAVMATSASLSNYTRSYRGGEKAAFSDSDRLAAVGK
jgi:hypothetical protein